jgi:hypothetical protein
MADEETTSEVITDAHPVDDAKAKASTEAYNAATETNDPNAPTGEEPVTDLDGTVVNQEDMPANGVWPGQSGELREQGAPGQHAQDDEAALTGDAVDQGTAQRVADEGGQSTETPQTGITAAQESQVPGQTVTTTAPEPAGAQTSGEPGTTPPAPPAPPQEPTPPTQ